MNKTGKGIKVIVVVKCVRDYSREQDVTELTPGQAILDLGVSNEKGIIRNLVVKGVL